MSFEPLQFLRLGNALSKVAVEQSREDVARAAIGRLYYAVHLQAREHLVATGFELPSFDQHSAVIDELRVRGHRQTDMIKSLKRLRIRSDYVLDEEVTSSDVKRAQLISRRVWPNV